MNIYPVWERCRRIPGGSFFFNQFLRYAVPYTGSLGTRVAEFSRGSVTLKLRQRRGVENHLSSIHAVALMNLCEAASGLSVISALTPQTRAILVNFKIEFEKKARGTLTASSRTTLPEVRERTPHQVKVHVTNEKGEQVCWAEATWLIDPI